MSIRLNKFIANSGIASRRQADKLIESGKVVINGKKVFEMGIQVDPDVDKVVVEGKPIKRTSQNVYYAFYKPKRVVTTLKDPQGRPCLADYFMDEKRRLFPVGRLDWDTEGLIIVTDDGDFSQKVAHPKSTVPKTYHVKLSRKPKKEDLDKLKKGVSIPGGKVSALHVSPIKSVGKNKNWVKIVITEGKNRQIRHMFQKIGYLVEKLQRVSIGKLTLSGIDRGEFKKLSDKDLKKVFESPAFLLPKKKKKRKTSPKRG